jgi:hypothetical protein
MISSPQFNCFSLHRERGNVLSYICYTRMRLTPRSRKSLAPRRLERKKSHAKTQSRKDRIRKEFLWMKAARETEVGSSVIGPKVSQSGSIWKLVSSFLCGFASWREVFPVLASQRGPPNYLGSRRSIRRSKTASSWSFSFSASDGPFGMLSQRRCASAKATLKNVSLASCMESAPFVFWNFSTS